MDSEESAAILEEYKALQAEKQIYLKQRTPTLTAVVAAVGVLLGFGSRVSPLIAIIALYVVLIGGALITWNSYYQLARRAAYIEVVLEPKMPGLEWFTTVKSESSRPYKIPVIPVELDPWWVPHEFPLCYFLLGIACILYAIIIPNGGTANDTLIVALGGQSLLTFVLVGHQVLNSRIGREWLVRRWERAISE